MTRPASRSSAAAGVALTAGLALLSGCTGGGGNTNVFHDPGVPAGALRLVAFDNCANLLSGLRAAAKTTVGPWGFGAGYALDGNAVAGGAPAPAAADGAARGTAKSAPDTTGYSSTNTHEAGVDEPDLVKTDGRRIVTVAGGVLRVVDAGSRKVTGTLDIESGATGDVANPNRYGLTNLLLAGDHALLFGQENGKVVDGPAGPQPDGIVGPRLTLVDLNGTPRILGRYSVDGRLLDARQIGSTARVVVHSGPRLVFPNDYRGGIGDDAARTAANAQVIDAAPVDDWLPRYSTVDSSGKRSSGRVDCNQVSRPATYSGTAMLTVLTFDIGGGALGTGDPVSVVADGDTVYANGPSLYVADDQRWRAFPMRGLPADAPARVMPNIQPKTQVYKFDISGDKRPRFAAAGEVSGWLLNQYSLSEWDGHLRVATTTALPWASPGAKSESTVYVLRQNGGQLAETGRVGGLGKGERIYAVRFVGTTGYVVTFRQTDPLYTVDLRDPKAPKVAGELKITGYSAYLHPAGDGRLIGIGQEASQQGRVQGTLVSLFDVTDLANPKRVAQYQMRNTRSEAEYDPHAFLYWPQTNLLVVPLYAYTPNAQTQGALALAVRDSGITEVGTVTHPGTVVTPKGVSNTQIRRSLVINQTLWTVSDGGLQAHSLSTLAAAEWLPFG